MSAREGEAEVLIVGAGPVGLLLANLLGSSGIKVLIAERETALPQHSRAIGVTPPSLEILSKLGLDAPLILRGVPIREVEVFGTRARYLDTVTFRHLPGAHPFILSVPQARTMELLRESLRSCGNVVLREGCEITGVEQNATGCLATLKQGEPIRARYVVGCDGARSLVRASMHATSGQGSSSKAQPRVRSYPCHFAMGDFTGALTSLQAARSPTTRADDIARLYFTADGAVESFPMPGGIRRWIVQTAHALEEIPPGLIPTVVHVRTGISLDPVQQLNASAFTPRSMNSAAYVDRHLLLCGDAAHLMSPIGGQGMNCGFADAEYLAEVLCMVLREKRDAESLFAAYHQARTQSAVIATRRAERGMRIGTWRGTIKSHVRDLIFRTALLRGPLASSLAPYFAMLTLPGANLARLNPAFHPRSLGR